MEFDNDRRRLVDLCKYTAGDWRSYEWISGLSHAPSMRSYRQCFTAVRLAGSIRISVIVTAPAVAELSYTYTVESGQSKLLLQNLA